jgi:hypothetical protein
MAGMSAMTLLAMVLEFSRCRPPDIPSAPLKLVYLALGYGAAMGLANLLFSLGPRIEARLQPARVERFRRWAFGLGFAISVALPLALPLLFLARCELGPGS